jgi:hypothetical protein
MEFCCAATGAWASTESDDPTDPVKRSIAAENRKKLDQLLTDILLSENLLVLAGLGTSACVTDQNGKPLAPSMKDLWKNAEQQAGKKFDELKVRVKYRTPASGDNIELLLSQCQMAQQFEPNKEVEEFIKNTESMIVDSCDFVNDQVNLLAHELFLRKVGKRSTRLPRLRLFTTNYDRCFETAASHTRFVAIDGFSHTLPQEFDGVYFSYDFVRREQDREIPDYIPNVLQLFKLHGSVDWDLQEGQVVKTAKPQNPLLIYPRYSKFETSYDQPFIEVMSRFQLSMRQPNTGLIIIGHGFNDHHISQPVMAGVRSNTSLKAIVVDPAIKTTTNTSLKQIEGLIKDGDWRLTLAQAKFEDIVAILPDLVTDNEEEQHLKRLRAIGKKP